MEGEKNYENILAFWLPSGGLAKLVQWERKPKIGAVKFVLKMEFLGRLEDAVPTAVAVTMAPRRFVSEQMLHTHLWYLVSLKMGGRRGERERNNLILRTIQKSVSYTENSTVCRRAKLFGLLPQDLLKTMSDSLIHEL